MVSEARGSFICVKIFSEYESIFIEENFRKKKIFKSGEELIEKNRKTDFWTGRRVRIKKKISTFL